MVSVEDLKEAVSLLNGVSDIKETSMNTLEFKCAGVSNSISTFAGDKISEIKICLLNFFQAPKEIISRSMGEHVSEVVNMNSLTPTKVVFIFSSNAPDTFACRNVFTDCLGELSKSKKVNRELFISNLKVMILNLMIENISCLQDIKNGVDWVLKAASYEK